MPSLLKIADELLSFRELLEEDIDEHGVISDESASALDQWFAELGDQRDAKLDNYAALCREMTLRAAVRKEEAERLLKRVQADENAVKRLKERAKLFMELTGEKKIETAGSSRRPRSCWRRAAHCFVSSSPRGITAKITGRPC